jgi:hypothetical protein
VLREARISAVDLRFRLLSIALKAVDSPSCSGISSRSSRINSRLKVVLVPILTLLRNP